MHKMLLFFVIIVIICTVSFILQISLESLFTPSHSTDSINLEYIKYELMHNQNNTITSMQSEILIIEENGIMHYKMVSHNNILEKESELPHDELQKLISIIKDTGFLSLAQDYLYSNNPVNNNFNKHMLNISFNSKQHKISWNTNDAIISPPIINAVELELSRIISQLIK